MNYPTPKNQVTGFPCLVLEDGNTVRVLLEANVFRSVTSLEALKNTVAKALSPSTGS
jgi:protein-disulfide isomerase-like protein with CxxC motif